MSIAQTEGASLPWGRMPYLQMAQEYAHCSGVYCVLWRPPLATPIRQAQATQPAHATLPWRTASAFCQRLYGMRKHPLHNLQFSMHVHNMQTSQVLANAPNSELIQLLADEVMRLRTAVQEKRMRAAAPLAPASAAPVI